MEDDAESKGGVVKQEKVKIIAQSHKNRTPLQSCCSVRVALLTRVQSETAEGTEQKADESDTSDTQDTQDTFVPCLKTDGCIRMFPIGQKHRRGACVVNGNTAQSSRRSSTTLIPPKIPKRTVP